MVSSSPTGSLLSAPPDLQPHSGSSSPESEILPIERATDLLLKILAKLTVYQSLPDNASLVVSVRDDVPMADACCLLLPSDKPRGASAVTFASIEVLRSEPSVSDDFWKSLSDIANEIRDHDPLLSASLEQESKEAASASYTPPSSYLVIADVLFFSSIDEIDKSITVTQWLDWRRHVALHPSPGHCPSLVRFCREMSLVSRATMSLCPGMRSGGLCSGSSMNLSLASLLKSNSDLSTTSTSPKSIDLAVKSTGLSGGSTLAAVTALLDRPWQLTLPLTVSSEKGVTAIFTYINLNQLMASVAMNCSDRTLEPFFATEVKLDGVFGFTCERNLENVPALHNNDATLLDAILVLRASPIALLLSQNDETFIGFVTQDDIAKILANRMDIISDYSDGTNEGMLDLKSTYLSHELARLDASAPGAVAVMKKESDFPCSFASLLQRILLHSSGFALVLSRENKPAALITVRDVWAHAMTTNQADPN